MSDATEILDLPAEVRSMRRHWTREEFERAGDLGFFAQGERLELVGGEVISKVTPQRSLHASAISLAEEALRRVLPAGHHLRVQLPLALGSHSEPEPDLAMVVSSPRDYESEHPRTAVLVVEVADTTLSLDRGVKAGLYAQAGVPEYWIVNLRDRVLEVHKEPAPMADQPFGHHYRSVTRHPETALVSPCANPGTTVSVADILPRRPLTGA